MFHEFFYARRHTFTAPRGRSVFFFFFFIVNLINDFIRHDCYQIPETVDNNFVVIGRVPFSFFFSVLTSTVDNVFIFFFCIKLFSR